MSDSMAIGARVREARKRRGLTQHELAVASGLSISLITKLEQGAHGGVRLETLHKLAKALRATTTSLTNEPDAAEPDPSNVADWGPLRRAIRAEFDAEPDDEPTIGGTRDAISDAIDAVLDTRYSELRATLPALLRDAEALVSVSANGAEIQARQMRSEARQLAAYMMAQTWQFDAASHAIELAISDASDDLTAMAAADWKSWVLLRQGRLAESGELAARWADTSEPRKLSTARTDELAAWGLFLARVSNVAARDNRPDDARDTLRLARAAATVIGRDIIPSFSPWLTFGPMTVAIFQAENAIIQGRPDAVLAIGSQIESRTWPLPRNRLRYMRHRLDVAYAYAATRRYAEAVQLLRELRAAAPEWLTQQRYAQEILTTAVTHRRTLTYEMRDLAAFMQLPL